jgi:hypothetical protein
MTNNKSQCNAVHAYVLSFARYFAFNCVGFTAFAGHNCYSFSSLHYMVCKMIVMLCYPYTQYVIHCTNYSIFSRIALVLSQKQVECLMISLQGVPALLSPSTIHTSVLSSIHTSTHPFSHSLIHTFIHSLMYLPIDLFAHSLHPFTSPSICPPLTLQHYNNIILLTYRSLFRLHNISIHLSVH